MPNLVIVPHLSRALRLAAFLCLLATGASLPAGGPERGPGEKPRDRRALVIGIDGTRPDALLRAETPNLDDLIRRGAFTDRAQVLGPRYQGNDTISGPGWASLLTGVWADKHGIQNNRFEGARIEAFPHFFKRLKDARPQATTISLVSWEPIHQFILAEADIREALPLPRGEGGGTTDLKVSANRLQIDTRDGKWHHLLARRENGVVTLYLDGRLAGRQEDVAGAFDLDGGWYYLGRDTRAGGTAFRGQLDDCRLWSRALTEGEIRQTAEDTLRRDGREQLLFEHRFEPAPRGDSKGPAPESLFDSAGHRSGPFPAFAVSANRPPKFLEESRETGKPVSRSLDLTEDGGKEHGVRLSLAPPLRSATRGDFTIEARFRTTDAGRGILMGNFAGSTGALNLELHENNTVRIWVQAPGRNTGLELENERDRLMAERAAGLLAKEDPTAMFVYFHQVDATGHGIGFSPEVPEYVRAIENVDRYVGTVLQGLRSRPTYDREDWLILVCTDHGGLERGHGNGHNVPEIRTVFVLVSGDGAKVGRIEEPVYLVDVAATALTHLVGPIDPKWELDGRAVGLKPAP